MILHKDMTGNGSEQNQIKWKSYVKFQLQYHATTNKIMI